MVIESSFADRDVDAQPPSSQNRRAHIFFASSALAIMQMVAWGLWAFDVPATFSEALGLLIPIVSINWCLAVWIMRTIGEAAAQSA